MKKKLAPRRLFVRKGRHWCFPAAPKPRVCIGENIRVALPLYLPYPEFLLQAGSSLTACKPPSKEEALQACRQIKVEKGDFLAKKWMKNVSKTWRETLSPDFAFQSADGGIRYWWCGVMSAKGACDILTYLLLAVDARGELLRYSFYSTGEISEGSHHYLIRFNKTRFQREETYKSAKAFMSNVRNITRKGEHFICWETTRDEFFQAILNRDGTFCMEYQMYHMPWQMASDGHSMEDVLRMVRLFIKGGIPSIACAIGWKLCEHNRRKPFDIGATLKKNLEKAEKSGCHEIADTIRAVGVTSETQKGQIVCPVFLDAKGRPVHWNTTLFHLPKSTSMKVRAAIRICASLDKESLPYHLHELGTIFSEGRGVRRNNRLALFWEKKALRNGVSAARHEVCRLKAILDPGHKEKSARKRAK